MNLLETEAVLRAAWQRGMAGDSDSYAQSLRSLGGMVRGFLRRRMSTRPNDVEDLVQDILLAIHLKRHTYDSAQPLTAWVHAIARYKLIDHLRSHYRREALHDDIDDWADSLWEAPDHEAGDSSRDLNRLLEALPDKQRLPIMHVKLKGLSVTRTAELVGQSESAVKVNIHRGLKALARLWQKEGDSSWAPKN